MARIELSSMWRSNGFHLFCGFQFRGNAGCIGYQFRFGSYGPCVLVVPIGLVVVVAVSSLRFLFYHRGLRLCVR